MFFILSFLLEFLILKNLLYLLHVEQTRLKTETNDDSAFLCMCFPSFSNKDTTHFSVEHLEV